MVSLACPAVIAICDAASGLNVVPTIFFHRLRGSASPVLRPLALSMGKGNYRPPNRIDTPQPITKTFVTGDYVGDP